MTVFTLKEGAGPLVVSMPHSGLELVPGQGVRLSPAARDLPDTDWHIPQLYDFISDLDANVIEARYSRYVVDLNRDPSGVSLYPGQAVTGLVPTELFDGTPLYLSGQAPDEAEIAHRRTVYFEPYHQALNALLQRVKARHGYAVLWDAHSIASRVPRLFDGRLPDLNLGTNSGQSCAPALQSAAENTMAGQEEFVCVANGRFKGGWITRQYGQPAAHIHALQMEIAQDAYMDEGLPFAFNAAKAERLRPVLKTIITAALDAAKTCPAGA